MNDSAELAAAVQELLTACGIASFLCLVTADFDNRSAAESLRFAAHLARKATTKREAIALEAAANRFMSFLPDNNRATSEQDRFAAAEIVKAYHEARRAR